MSRYLRAPILAFLLSAAGHGVAQQPSERPPDDLQETIEWLGGQLKQYGRMNFASASEPGVFRRQSFDGMRTDGCRITYRIKFKSSYAPSSDFMNGPVGGTSYSEYSVDLKDLEPSLVKAAKPKGWKGGRIDFGAAGGRRVVTSRDKRGKVSAYDGGTFYVSEEAAVDAVAEALRRAVSMCKE
jgi:hypothetical protein